MFNFCGDMLIAVASKYTLLNPSQWPVV